MGRQVLVDAIFGWHGNLGPRRSVCVEVEPFRGSRAVADGLVTPKRLRGPGFVRLYPDIYVDAATEVDYAVLSRAAYLLVAGRGVLCGFSAAELLGASCGPLDGPAEVLVPRGRKALPRLTVYQGAVRRDELVRVGDVWLTSPVRTAFDLACRGPLVESVVALDALGHHQLVDPWEVVRLGHRHPGVRGKGMLAKAARLANRDAESPMETRIRIAIVLAGLPVPVLQHPLGPYYLDMAYPELRLGVEYDGREHLDQRRALRDLARENAIGRAGWTVIRFRAAQVLGSPDQVAVEVRQMIASARASAPLRGR